MLMKKTKIPQWFQKRIWKNKVYRYSIYSFTFGDQIQVDAEASVVCWLAPTVEILRISMVGAVIRSALHISRVESVLSNSTRIEDVFLFQTTEWITSSLFNEQCIAIIRKIEDMRVLPSLWLDCNNEEPVSRIDMKK